MYFRKIFIVVVTLFFIIEIQAQTIYEHVSNKNIYEFIDELANQKIIEINSVVKPYSRMFIADKLIEAKSATTEMSKRQQKELIFYLNAFRAEIDSLPDYPMQINIFKKNENLMVGLNPLGLFYKDRLLTFSVEPIWGIEYFDNENGSMYHSWGGLKANAYVGKNWSFYPSLRDNSETEIISAPEYFTQRGGGGNYKSSATGGVDYEEMRGGIVYSWKWGSFGLIKDHLNWGNNYHGPNIFNDRPPSVTQITLNMKPAKWFELNYFHAWLVSMVVDSSRSYYYTRKNNLEYRETFRPKYMAANMMTITPWKRLNISMGNSIVYADMNVYPGYLIPFMFYKAIDHTVNSGIDNQNSQMFFDISSRQIKHLHLYGTLYIDEFKKSRIYESDEHNFWSLKAGMKESNFLINNLSVTFEYTMTMPVTYQHYVPTLTFASNDYNFGHYLRDNSREFYTSIEFKPIRGLHFKGSFTLAQHGDDYVYEDIESTKNPYMQNITWEKQEFSIGARWEFISNSYIYLEYIYSDISGNEEQVKKYTPEFFRGQQNTISAGFNLGF